jgi:predicted transposase YbfD/YdcC
MPRNPDKIDYSGGLPAHFESFEIIEDPRTGGNKRHHFGEVLFMATSAMLCGMNGFSDIEHFCELQEDWLKKWISMPNGIPRAQTFSNIFSIIDPDLFKACLIDHLGTLQPILRDRIIALDGKRLRGSHGLKTDPIHAVSAWVAQSGITLAQEFVGEKSNEIEAIPRLLESLDLAGHTVTIDAMGTHTHIAEKITSMGGDYLLALKGNQGNMHKEAQDHFDFALRQLDLSEARGWSTHSESEKAHGRITTRTVLTTTNLGMFDAEIKAKWPALASLSVVETESRSTTTGKKRKREKRYYISSRKEDAEYFQQAIRSHWSIENRCHWILDTAFREDHNQTYIGNAAKNLGTLRRIVLNILHDDPGTVKTVPKKRLEALLNTSYRERLLSLA